MIAGALCFCVVWHELYSVTVSTYRTVNGLVLGIQHFIIYTNLSFPLRIMFIEKCVWFNNKSFNRTFTRQFMSVCVYLLFSKISDELEGLASGFWEGKGKKISRKSVTWLCNTTEFLYL